MTKQQKYTGWIAYVIAILLLSISFFLPPEGVIDSSALIASSILLAGQQLIWGNKIKEFTIDKTGLHMINKD